MKLTKLGLGIIAVLFVVSAVSLSLLVARQNSQYLPYRLTRIDYLDIVMKSSANSLLAKYDVGDLLLVSPDRRRN